MSGTPVGKVGQPDGGARAGRITVSRRWLLTLSALVLAPWIVVAIVMARIATAPERAGAPVAAAPTVVGGVGPWGQLVTTPVAISPPIEYVSRQWGEVQPSVWYFPAMTGDELETRLVSFGLPREDAARLRAGARSSERARGLLVTPDPELVRTLSPDVRARIYSALGRAAVMADTDVPVNFDQMGAYRYAGTSVDEWLGTTMVSAETRQIVAPYVYPHNGFLFFADIERVRSRITDPDELQRLAKRLLRQSTLLVRLQVSDRSSIDELVEYWGRGGRRTDLRPLLESVERGTTAGDVPYRLIDISHLLPPIARQHLYRYPRPTVADMQRSNLANCLWTALNFFNEAPDDRYLEPQYAIERLKTDYFLVQDGFQLGDVVAFSDARGVLFHAAVYLADDLLFSKNGTSPLAPWTILPFDHFKGHYAEYADDWRVTYHRRKDM